MKLGFILPLSGPVALYGAALKYASALIVKQVNSSGGINGSPLQIISVDSPNNPNDSVTGLRRLANQDKVDAVLGPYYTGEMQAAAPIANQLKIPVLGYTPAASYPGLVDPGQWAFLDAQNESTTVGRAIAGYKKAYPNIKKMVVVGDTSVAVTALTIKKVWPKLLPQNGYTIVDTITYNFSTTDFSPIVTRIKASGAQGIALSSLSPAAPTLLKQLQSNGVKLPVVASSHLHTVPPLPAILGSTANGLVQTMFWSPQRAKDPQVAKWVATYEQLERQGGTAIKNQDFGYAQEPETYDAFSLLVKALRDAGVNGSTSPTVARQKVQQGLKKIKNFPGVSGSITVNSTDHITYPAWALMAQNGVYQEIK